MPLTIPKRTYPAVVAFSNYSEEEFRVLLRVLKTAKPSLDPTELVVAASSELGKPQPSLEGVIGFITNIYVLQAQTGLSNEAMVAEVVKAISEAKQLGLSLDSAKEPALQARLTEVMGVGGNLSIMAKVADVAAEQSNSFCACRVMTDLRPIFSSDPSKKPTGGVVIHSLKIVYHTDGDSHRTFFVALDKSDLLAIRAQVDRALKKEDAIKASVSGTIEIFEERS